MKIWKKILILATIAAIFLLPISPGLELAGNKLFSLNKNVAEAAFSTSDFVAPITASRITSGSATLQIVLQSTRAGAFSDYIQGRKPARGAKADSTFQIQISDTADFSNVPSQWTNHPTWEKLGYATDIGVFSSTLKLGSNMTDDAGSQITLQINFGGLKTDTTYYARFTMQDAGGNDVNITNPIATFQTLKTDAAGVASTSTSEITNTANLEFSCGGILGVGVNPFSTGCLASLSYNLWSVSALVAEGAGKFLDFFVYYSTNSTSYRNEFVQNGWGAVRDIANIFFIIALLYVAIKTVLSLDASNSKKLIGYIILFALLLNFSLFITKVVIDGTNILAKVFYNNITPIGANGNTLPANSGGQKSISIGLISKFNPQTIVDQKNYDISHMRFVFISLVAFAVTIYTAYIFFAVALLFVARVASLWIAMVFAPLAFASYTVPFDIPGFGHKKWWENLLKNAFLAPLFVFFLYIIVLFAKFLPSIAAYPIGTDFMQHLMSVLIPFALLIMLLRLAKKLAEEYAGEMGKAVMTAGKMVGGLVTAAAGGAVFGGAAVLGRATIGRAGTYVANTKWAKEREARGGLGSTLLRSTATAVGGKSFDVRGATIGGKTLAGTTGLNLGEASKGGFTERRKAQVEKRQKRAKDLEVGEDEGLKHNLNLVERDLQDLLRTNSGAIEMLDKRITTARQNLTDANTRFGAGTPQADAAGVILADLKGERGAIKNGTTFTTSGGQIINHSTNRVGGVATGASINDLEDNIIPAAHHAIQDENRNRRYSYAGATTSRTEQAKQWLLTGGQYSPAGAKEAAHKIIMEQKLDSGDKSTH